MLKGFLSKEKIVLGALLLILLGLISFITFRFELASIGVISAQQLYSGMQKSLNPSQATVTLDKTNLKINFKINQLDKNGLENQEIDIKLGDFTAEYLNKIMMKNNLITENSRSLNLNLRILSKEIDFDNKKVFGPFDSSSENLLESPSDTGNIRIQSLGEDSYLIEIDNPEKVLSEATISGKLKLSENLIDSQVWQILTKLARIRLKVEDGMLRASVFLK